MTLLRWWDGSAWTEHTKAKTEGSEQSPAPAGPAPVAGPATGLSEEELKAWRKRTRNKTLLIVGIILAVVFAGIGYLAYSFQGAANGYDSVRAISKYLDKTGYTLGEDTSAMAALIPSGVSVQMCVSPGGSYWLRTSKGAGSASLATNSPRGWKTPDGAGPTGCPDDYYSIEGPLIEGTG